MTQSAQGPLASSSSIFLQVFKPYLHIFTQSLVAVAITMPNQPRQLMRKPLNWRQEFAMAHAVRKDRFKIKTLESLKTKLSIITQEY